MADWQTYVRDHLPPLGLSPAREIEVVAELAQQIELAYHEALAGGASEPEARRRAERQFSDWPALAQAITRAHAPARRQIAAPARSFSGGIMLTDLFRDLRHGLRLWRRSPGFTLLAVLILALGIGANAAVFTLIDAVLLRRLPVTHPERLVALTDPGFIGMLGGSDDGTRPLLSYPEYLRLRDENHVFSGLLATQSQSSRIEAVWGSSTEAGGEASPAPFQAKLVSGNYFRVLGVGAERGRLFTPADDTAAGSNPVAVMSDACWRHRFGANPAIIGGTLRLRAGLFTVIGITPPGFAGENIGDSPEIFFPLSMQLQVRPGRDLLHDPAGVSRWMWLQVIGRLDPGITLAQAQAASNIIFAQSVAVQAAAASDAARRRDLLSQRLELSPAGRGTTDLRAAYSAALYALWALVGLVLLMAVVNLACMLLARATARQQEMGVRLALGAGRGRLLRQLMAESLVLAAAGGVTGLWLAQASDRLLLRWVASTQPDAAALPLQLHPDARILGFTAGISLLAGVLFGLAPGLQLARLRLQPNLALQARGSGARAPRLARRWLPRGVAATTALAVAQVAVSVLLLTGAGVFVQSLRQLRDRPLGFNPQQLTLYGLNAPADGYAGARGLEFYQSLRDRIARLPGVAAVSLSENGVFTGSDSGNDASFEGNSAPPAELLWDQIAPGYFAALQVPVLLGRGFTPQDASGPRPMVINQTTAQTYFAHTDPLGKHVTLHSSGGDVAYAVVGVAADFKFNDVREKPAARVFVDIFNGLPADELGAVSFEVRGGTSPASIRAAVRQLDPSLPPPRAEALAPLINGTLASDILLARLSGVFGLLALLLAAIGLYGVLSYSMARRTGEIGIRMALGAPPARVRRMVLADVVGIATAGLALGLPISFGAARWLAHLSLGLASSPGASAISLGAAAALLLGVALGAGYLPARRASRLDPLTALRCE